MPGIAGFVGMLPADARAFALDRMVEPMRRESFYSSGTYFQPRLGVALGWVVHKGGFDDCNPVWNETRDICLVFTGEEFTDSAEIASLRAKGHQFSVNDGSYLAHWYEERGSAFLSSLNGCCSGVVLDLRQNKVLLFNDRHGLSRIYVHETDDGVYFSSEAKSLLRALPKLRQLDPVGLAELSTCGCTLLGRTLFANISLLPPASLWTFGEGRLLLRETYFQKEALENLPRLREDEFYEKFRATFPRIVRKYFGGPLAIGMSLTGGLDGRMIMASGAHAPGALPCYTFGGTYRDSTDVTLAREIARDCGQSHRVISVDDSFLGQFATLAEQAVYISDGAMGVGGSVELFCNRLAREIAPVRMTGNYGSEILRSHVAFKPQLLNAALFAPEFLQLGRSAANTYRQVAQGRRLSFIAFKQVPWHHYSRLSVEQSQMIMRTPYLDNEVLALQYQAPAGDEFSKEPALRFVSEHNRALGRIPTDRGFLYRSTPVLATLRTLYQEFTVRAEYAYDYGMPALLARVDHFFAPLHLERAFLGRHKFYHFRVWYRDKLGTYLREVLLDPRSRTRAHLVDGQTESLVKEHLAGTHNHTLELHLALSVELIYRQLIERDY